jgi:hypothetical protein
MAQVQITDVVVPAEFTAYQVENSMVSTALFQSGVVLPQWRDAGSVTGWAQQFTVPFWSDIPDIVWTVRSGRLPGEPTGYPPKKRPIQPNAPVPACCESRWRPTCRVNFNLC